MSVDWNQATIEGAEVLRPDELRREILDLFPTGTLAYAESELLRTGCVQLDPRAASIEYPPTLWRIARDWCKGEGVGFRVFEVDAAHMTASVEDLGQPSNVLLLEIEDGKVVRVG